MVRPFRDSIPGRTVARRILIWAVLLITPFTGVRVVCLDAPADATVPEIAASQDCDEWCPRPPKAQPKRGDVSCALKAGTCNQLLAATVAVVPACSSSSLQLIPTAVTSLDAAQYAAPVILPDSPPPKR